MKALTLFATFFILTLAVKAQTVNDTPIKDIDVDYVRIVGTSKAFSTKLIIELDFGQRTKFVSTGKETIIKDENNQPITFNSMIDALNFMSKYGWDFVDSNVVTFGQENVYQYLLKKNRERTATL